MRSSSSPSLPCSPGRRRWLPPPSAVPPPWPNPLRLPRPRTQSNRLRPRRRQPRPRPLRRPPPRCRPLPLRRRPVQAHRPWRRSRRPHRPAIPQLAPRPPARPVLARARPVRAARARRRRGARRLRHGWGDRRAGRSVCWGCPRGRRGTGTRQPGGSSPAGGGVGGQGVGRPVTGRARAVRPARAVRAGVDGIAVTPRCGGCCTPGGPRRRCGHRVPNQPTVPQPFVFADRAGAPRGGGARRHPGRAGRQPPSRLRGAGGGRRRRPGHRGGGRGGRRARTRPDPRAGRPQPGRRTSRRR